MNKILFIGKSVLLGALIVVCLGGCGEDTADYVRVEETQLTESENAGAKQQPADLEQTESSAEHEIYIYVCGAIAQPGVYTLPEGSRVCDLFQLAGGLTKDAATDYWNQARVLVDGEMLYVPTADEVKEQKLSGGDASATNQAKTDDNSDDNKVNINTASKEELMTIPGIGEAKALAIIAYRQENGPFSSIEEVKNVEGIKDGVYSKMKDYIEIN